MQKLSNMNKIAKKEIEKRSVECFTGEKKVKHIKFYLTKAQESELIKEVGDAPAILMMKGYVDRAGLIYSGRPPRFDDEKFASMFGWSQSKAKKARLKLQNAGYILTHKGKLTGGTKTVLTVIGKEAVAEHKKLIKHNLEIRYIKSSYDMIYDDSIIDVDVVESDKSLSAPDIGTLI